jgi:hypothetical protein
MELALADPETRAARRFILALALCTLPFTGRRRLLFGGDPLAGEQVASLFI